MGVEIWFATLSAKINFLSLRAVKVLLLFTGKPRPYFGLVDVEIQQQANTETCLLKIKPLRWLLYTPCHLKFKALLLVRRSCFFLPNGQ